MVKKKITKHCTQFHAPICTFSSKLSKNPQKNGVLNVTYTSEILTLKLLQVETEIRIIYFLCDFFFALVVYQCMYTFVNVFPSML